MGNDPTGQMHHPYNVGKASMFCRWVDPPSGLKLMDMPQPLHPGMVDDLAFGNFIRFQVGTRSEGDVAVDGVVAQIFSMIISHPGIMPVPVERV